MFENSIIKVSFYKIASKASYFFGRTMLPDRSILKGQNISEKCKNSNETFWVIFKHCETEKNPIFDAKIKIVVCFRTHTKNKKNKKNI